MRSVVRQFREVAQPLLGYAIVTRMLMVVAVMPLFGLLSELLRSSRGQAVLTNANLGSFLLSWQGACLIILGFGAGHLDDRR